MTMRTHHRLALLAFAVTFATTLTAQPFARRAVVVTGASSGIGRKITERLSSNGFFVYAGARGAQEMADLAKLPNVQPIQLDVTKQAEVDAAVETVVRAGRGLYGVVNNAGVLVLGPLVETPEKDLDFIFGVNLYGPWRVTKAFAPLLFASRGRVVSISSLNGVVTSPMIGAYSMAKHATEAFGDGLAAELAPHGVRSILIEPGNYGTNIGNSLLARTDTTHIAESRFAQQIRGGLASMRSFDRNPPPDAVADAVLDAFTNEKPKPRYLVVPAAGQADVTIRKVMDVLVQLNEGHPFTYSRDELIKKLDEAMERAKNRR
jgi:NAD(P)-dependent dehydrogenase (short-subunit alcohol dehydrogenase family)